MGDCPRCFSEAPLLDSGQTASTSFGRFPNEATPFLVGSCNGTRLPINLLRGHSWQHFVTTRRKTQERPGAVVLAAFRMIVLVVLVTFDVGYMSVARTELQR